MRDYVTSTASTATIVATDSCAEESVLYILNTTRTLSLVHQPTVDSLSRTADPTRPDHPTESFPLYVISPRVPVLGPYLGHRARLCR